MLTYNQFKAAMFLTGSLVRVYDRLNKKQPLIDNIYHETPQGFRPYNNFYNDALEILSCNHIKNRSNRQDYIERLIRDITIDGELNQNADYLVATPSGKVIDLQALHAVMQDKKNITTYTYEWLHDISFFSDRRISLCTGVDYNPDINPQEGYQLVKELLSIMTSSSDYIVLEDTFQWLMRFMGRLLIGKNSWKEFIIFLGKKDSGKTTFVNILKDIMGSYGGIVSDEILYSHDTDTVARSLYILKDKRLLIHSEGSNQRKLNSVTLKRITGDSHIPLINQDYSFSMQGKIVEDTNYAPIPDNPNDEAFNERIVFIPFQNKPMQRESIDALIMRARNNKEVIFAAMVHSAAINMRGDCEIQKIKPRVSLYVGERLSILRNLEKAFYTRYCEIKLTDSIHVLGQDLLSAFHEWINRAIRPLLTFSPYLQGENVKYPSETEFHTKMKKIHTKYNSHTRCGLIYRGLCIRKDRIRLEDNSNLWNMLFGLDPELEAKKLIAQTIENDRKKIESFFTTDCLKSKLDLSMSKDLRKLENIKQGSPRHYNDAKAALITPPPTLSPYMQMNLYPNSFQGFNSLPLLPNLPIIAPNHADKPSQKPEPKSEPMEVKPESEAENVKSKSKKDLEDAPESDSKTEKTSSESNASIPTMHMLSEEEYEQEINDKIRKNPRAMSIPEELNLLENSDSKLKTYMTPFGAITYDADGHLISDDDES
jgi:energy-coupling factor transporter ATP-binding protein EcfA2